MTEEKKTFRPLTSKSVCLIYELLHKKGLVSFPPTENARQKVDALVASINSTYFGHTMYQNDGERAVAYLYFLIKDHPFVDGNKRTACLAFEVVCALNGLVPRYEGFSLDELAVFVEKIVAEDYQAAIARIAHLLFWYPRLPREK